MELVKTEEGYKIDGVQVISTDLIAKEFDRTIGNINKEIERKMDNPNYIFEESIHYFLIRKEDYKLESLKFGMNESRKLFLTERGFLELVIPWRGIKAAEIRNHVLDVYFKAKEIHQQGITEDYKTGVIVGEVNQKINYLTDTIIQLIESVNQLQMSELDMFATEDGGFYRKEVNKLVRKRSKDKSEKITDTWFYLYKAFKNKTGLDPFTMSDSVGVSKMDWIATKGRLKTLYEVALKLCADRVWDESNNKFEYNVSDDTPLDEVE